MYRLPARPEAFAEALRFERTVYNGDLFSPGDIAALRERYPGLGAVMLGPWAQRLTRAYSASSAAE